MDSSPTLRFSSWSDLHCRLMWAYEGPVQRQFTSARYTIWPLAGWLIRKGNVTLAGDYGEQVIPAGHWVFPGTCTVQQNWTGSTDIISLRFVINWLSGSPLFDHQQTIAFPSSRFPELEVSATELVRNIHARLGDTYTQLGLAHETATMHFAVMRDFYRWSHNYVQAMIELGQQANLPAESDARIDRAATWLRNRPFSLPWREPQLADLCGLSVSQLNRLFVRYHGLTPLAFYDRHRLQTARQLLVASDDDIKAIAFDLGFSTPGNFTMWFKRKTGETPSAWRRLNAAALS